MRALPLDEIASRYGARPLPVPLLHVNGQILHAIGEEFDPNFARALAACGIPRVFVPDTPDEAAHLETRFRKMKVSPAEGVGRLLAEPLYDGTTVLAHKETVLTDRVAELLVSRAVTQVQVSRSTEEMQAELARVMEYHRKVRDLAGVEKRLGGLESIQFEEREGPIELTALDLLAESPATEAPAGPPVKDSLVRHNPVNLRTSSLKLGYEDVHDEVLAGTEILYQSVRHRERIEGKILRQLVHKIVALLIEDREYLLNLTHIKYRRGYFVNHAVNTAILAVNTAVELGLSSVEVLEVGFAAILSDLGMQFVPAKILEKKGELDAAERLEVAKHVGWTLDALAKVGGLPPRTPLVIYQSHERMNGSGYPKKRTKHIIQRGARILAVADVYDSLTTLRPWRAAFLPYDAVVQTLHHVNQGLLDRDSVVGLLGSISLFPIGSWVELDDARLSKVVSTNPEDYCRPRLRTFFRGTEKLDPPELVSLAKGANPVIKKAVDGSDFEVALSIGF